MVDDRQYTTPHKAAWERRNGVVQYLLANGARVDVVDNSGYLPFHNTSYNGNSEVVQPLLQDKSDINGVVGSSAPPFMFRYLMGIPWLFAFASDWPRY